MSQLGLEQAKIISKRLKEYSFDLAFSSDLKRASDTAKEILKYHNINLKFDKRLREINFGDTAGKTKKEINWDVTKYEHINKRYPNGECWLDVLDRVKDFVKEIGYELQEEKENILIVCHGGIIASLLNIFIGRSLEHTIFEHPTRNTSLFILKRRGNEFKLIVDNCTKHNNQS